ncbi:PspC domain-containing protein [Solitalea canadensis]|uniref:Putative stress-responsive transcriptional regulator n=1 Tax=Solitalea canadensis (strain ATCC 29591 / DSM 3403 / JCM 21819 / LMG 8368 / NBRC 15130 / NCIMB 12057 / USAM 9D) TaxID=929556 RepID=H8KLY8_SOLCM|nr:PspC domain-containing protein [Solitalea canadensis]AFD08716.1 putative stress-responsive transcriptional regulator [Solitalea canadensis DSM 3403]
MNKTIIINISGIIFHIEEDAYEILKSYINDVKRHFASSSDSFEIITDIENRIAELCNEKLKSENKQVIVLADVEEVIAKMGKVSDFDIDEEPASSSAFTDAGINDAFSTKVKRRLFRDSDNQIVGGVCAGVANYLETDPTWIRLIWALLTLTWGFGLVIYFILWLAVPEAKTVADKMAMKGEAATLASIKKAASDKLNEVQNNSGVKNFLNRFFEVFGGILKWGLKAFVVLIGIVVIGSAILALFAIVTGSAAVLFAEAFGLENIPPLRFIEPTFRLPLLLSIFFLVLIPAIFIIWLGAKIIFNRSFLNKTAGFTMLAVWVIALLVFGVYAGKSAAGFKEEASIRQTIDLAPVKNNVWYLYADDKKWLTGSDSIRFNITLKSGKSISHYSDDFDLDEVNLRVEKSPDNKPHLVKVYKSKGKNFDNAISNAQNILYNYLQKDSSITFNRHYELKNEGLWRVQEVELILQLPVGQKIVVEKHMNSILRDPYFYECNEDRDEDQMTTQSWIVTETGIKCSNGYDPTAFKRSEDLDDFIKRIARNAIDERLKQKSVSGTITIDSNDQDINEEYNGDYTIRTQVTIKDGNNTVSEPYEIIIRKRKDAKDPYSKDTWKVEKYKKSNGEDF